MSTIAIAIKVAEAHERNIERGIWERLCGVGRILPGEVVAHSCVDLVGGGYRSTDERVFTFPNYWGQK